MYQLGAYPANPQKSGQIDLESIFFTFINLKFISYLLVETYQAADLTSILSVKSDITSFILMSDWASSITLGFRVGFWTIGLIVILVTKWRNLANFWFWGCNYSGSSLLSTIGGSTKSTFRTIHAFHVYLGSTTGSTYFLLGFFKNSLTFSFGNPFSKLSTTIS